MNDTKSDRPELNDFPIYEKAQIIAFLEKDISLCAEDEKNIKEVNNKIIEQAKEDRFCFLQAVYPHIDAYNNYYKEKGMKLLSEEKCPSCFGRREKKIWQKKQDELLEEYETVDYIFLEFKEGIIKYNFTNSYDDFCLKNWLFEHHNISWVDKTVKISDMCWMAVKDFSCSLSPLEYLKHALGRINCLHGPLINEDQLAHARIFMARLDRVIREVDITASLVGKLEK